MVILARLKRKSVSGVAAGWVQKVATGNFFFPTKKKKKMDNIFLQQKKS